MKRTLALLLPLTALIACGDDPSGPAAEAPMIDSISPARGTTGTEVRIWGSTFADSAQVYFGGMEALGVERESGSLFAAAPEGLAAGSVYDVRVVNDAAAVDTAEDGFEAVAPAALRVNGVTKPTGLAGMTVIVDGDAFGDRAEYGQIYFEGSDGTPVQAAIADTANDWTNEFVVTTVPSEVGDTSWIWAETETGVSDSIQFQLIETSGFSPSVIDWTQTTDLPQPLQGLGAVFVPIEEAPTPANYVYVAGGADTTSTATDAVYRAPVNDDGSLGSWATDLPALPEARAHHALVGATAYTAALDTTTTAAYLYAVGGLDSDGAVTSTVHYAHVGLDGAVDAWQTTEPLPQPLHSAAGAIFRGYLYLAGGADGTDVAAAAAYRAKVNADGTLGEWQALADLSVPRAYFSLVSFGPYLYAVGGETDTAEPSTATTTGTESAAIDLARIDLRTGGLQDGWGPAGDLGGESMNKERSKHSTLFAGGFLFATSGIYPGQSGSSENIYAEIGEAGALESWSGATGSNTILNALGYSLYNPAAVTFVAPDGAGHVLVLGGGRVESPGEPSAAVVYY